MSDLGYAIKRNCRIDGEYRIKEIDKEYLVMLKHVQPRFLCHKSTTAMFLLLLKPNWFYFST